MIDMVVYGQDAPVDRCQIFEALYPPFANKKYILREYDVSGRNDLSLNRLANNIDLGFSNDICVLSTCEICMSLSCTNYYCLCICCL